jgi:geranylgeranyl pyrophosphate synthase
MEAIQNAFTGDGLRELLPLDCPELPLEQWREAMGEALEDFLGRPSKGFRSRMTDFAWRAVRPEEEPPPALGILVEAIHAGSLIVDDIEDEAQMRRGGPSLHQLYGAGCALNAGNWLYFWPAALMDQLPLEGERLLTAQRLMSRTLLHCHFGQALDISTRIYRLPQEQAPRTVAAITRLKTACLMEFCTHLGALAAGGSDDQVNALRAFGCEAGTALQMLDDLGTVQSERRREKAREDLENASPTWVWAWTSEKAAPWQYDELREMARHVAEDAAPFEPLRHSLDQFLGEDMRTPIVDRLNRAVEDASSFVCSNDLLTRVRQELVRLEQSYG